QEPSRVSYRGAQPRLKPLSEARMMSAAVKVAVIGLGYVGVPLAAAAAATGADVMGIDIDSGKVESTNAGRSPLRGREPGLNELVKATVSKRKFRASLDPAAGATADVVAICVEPPIEPSTRDPSHKALKAAISSIGPHLKRGALVTIESTLAPGTMESVVRPALERASKMKVGRDLHLVHCPERLTTGKLLHHLSELPRIVGANEPVALRKALAFYGRFVNAEIHSTDWTTAEVVKTAENAYWDVQLAFANEVALISEELGVDAYRVRDLVNTCPFRMMLTPGAGVGGHCIPKDPWLLVSPAVQSKPELIPTAREVNDFMPRRMARIVEEALAASGRKIKGARVAVLGFTYRENTDDTRNSPAKIVIQELRRRGAEIAIHDPFARSERGYAVLQDVNAATKGADCVAIVTAHDEYRKLDLKALRRRVRHAAFVDGRDVYAGPDLVKMGFVYRGIGKGQFGPRSKELDELPRAVRVRRRDGHPQRFGRVFSRDERRPLVLDRIEEILELSSQRLFLPDVDFLRVVLEWDLVQVERVQGPEGARADRDRLLRVVDLDEVLETGEGELAHFHRREPVHLDDPVDSVLEPQQDVRVVLEGCVDLPPSEGEDALHRRADEVADDVDLVDAEVHHDADVPDAAGERTHAPRRRGHQVAVLSLLELALHDRDRRIVSLDVAHRERDARALRRVDDPERVRDRRRERLL